MRIEARGLTLRTRRPFTIAAGTRTGASNLLATLAAPDGEVVGWGEGAPNPRVSGGSVEDDLAALRGLASRDHAVDLQVWHSDASSAVETLGPAPSCAVTSALLDAAARTRGVAPHRLLDLPAGRRLSSMTLSVGSPAAVLAEAEACHQAGWRSFKVKLAGPADELVLRALRDRYPNHVLRVDANEAWSPATAAARLPLLHRLEVELIEQPLPRHLLEKTAELAAASEIPVVADEALTDVESARRVVAAGAGRAGNIKLSKVGGPVAAAAVVDVLRQAGWGVMIGCHLESSLGIAAAAAFVGVADWVDLDGAWLVEDPWPEGHVVGRDGWVGTPTQPLDCRIAPLA